MRSYLSNTENFDKIIEKFKKFISEKNPDRSVSFNDGWLYQQEGYKKKIPRGAQDTLETNKWSEKWIGTGEIIAHVILALKYQPPEAGGKLVDWRRWRYLDSIRIEEPEKTKRIESLIYRLYSEENTDAELFEQLAHTDAIGKKYDLISYLFFLKNSRRYLPNRPENFENAFALLGDPFVFRMSGQCSWINYSEFLNRISEIREILEPQFEEKISLIDAHSFCWVIAHNPDILEIDLDSGNTLNVQFGLTDPPLGLSEENLKPKEPRKFKPISKKEREKQERINNQIGNAGELFVWNAEKQLLEASKRPYLAEMMYHASKEEGDGLGYDIISFLPNGKVKLIEVKTTTGNENTKFFISDAELEFSRLNPDNYYLYRIYNFNKTAKENPYYELRGNMRKKLVLYPIQFYALPKDENPRNDIRISESN